MAASSCLSGHVFGKKCITQNFTESDSETCPTCRQAVDSSCMALVYLNPASTLLNEELAQRCAQFEAQLELLNIVDLLPYSVVDEFEILLDILLATDGLGLEAESEPLSNLQGLLNELRSGDSMFGYVRGLDIYCNNVIKAIEEAVAATARCNADIQKLTSQILTDRQTAKEMRGKLSKMTKLVKRGISLNTEKWMADDDKEWTPAKCEKSQHL
ncbi:hypothetical protein BD410DRAFT_809102 [Rickenella mellea]|uniref:Uncharacterized protein n=1 Tax=Rickenella mellea TaxID=50990 RepID=A0A4Y7PL93_9AGAM|nr:hypothetical protein BD410DRAFT_809102 [Rickenella mellea]